MKKPSMAARARSTLVGGVLLMADETLSWEEEGERVKKAGDRAERDF